MSKNINFYEYMKLPRAIEQESFKMIEEALVVQYGAVNFESALHQSVVYRCIHTAADFDYYKNILCYPGGLEAIREALNQGQLTLYTDTTMALAGINKRILERLGVGIQCDINLEGVGQRAKTLGITRSMAAVDHALQQPGRKLFVFGNAPTALFRLLEQADAALCDVVGIIGVPVGFVGAAESKEALSKRNLPFVTALGRKGGSNIAAAIVNALLYSISDNRG